MIDLGALIELQSTGYHVPAFEHGRYGSREFRIMFRGGYEVWHNGERVHAGMQPYNAVEKYNSIDLKAEYLANKEI